MNNHKILFQLVVGIFAVLNIPAFFLAGTVSVENRQRNMASFGGGDSDLSSQITSALEAHKNGQLDVAITLYEKVIPDTSGKLASTLCSNAGAIYMQIGDYENAHSSFKRAVDSSPENSPAHFNLAVILTTKLNKQARAIKHCGSAIQLDPNMHKAYHLMGNILQTIGRADEAEKYFLKAEELARAADPSSSSETETETETDSKLNTAPAGWSSLPVSSSKLGDMRTVETEGRSFSMTCVSERPRVFRVSQLLSDEECSHIMTRALQNSSFERSFVMGGGGGGGGEARIEGYQDGVKSDAAQSSVEWQSSSVSVPTDPYRLSHTTWLPLDPLLSSLQSRLALLTGIPQPYLQQSSEDLQVVRYGVGGRFKAHQDSSAFHPRLMTALVYLSEAPAGGGGDTWFPFAGRERPCELSVEEAVAMAVEEDAIVRTVAETARKSLLEGKTNKSEEGRARRRGGLTVSPVRGDALIFFNHLPDGQIDPAAVHAGLSIGATDTTDEKDSISAQYAEESCHSVTEQGYSEEQKWIANYWITQNLPLLKEYLNK
mmetsp:Transcript_16371/g.16485  ORF Transcript_16371/g.16485 Transcript_16371/m.16485 type:complete len:545 (-) Transcript_16371:57-1691(-)